MGSAATTYRPFLLHSAANDDGPPPQSNMRADGATSDNAKNASYSAALRPHGGTAPPKSKSFDMNSIGQEASRGGESPVHPIAASVMRRITISTSRTADSILMPYSSSKARRV